MPDNGEPKPTRHSTYSTSQSYVAPIKNALFRNFPEPWPQAFRSVSVLPVRLARAFIPVTAAVCRGSAFMVEASGTAPESCVASALQMYVCFVQVGIDLLLFCVNPDGAAVSALSVRRDLLILGTE